MRSVKVPKDRDQQALFHPDHLIQTIQDLVLILVLVHIEDILVRHHDRTDHTDRTDNLKDRVIDLILAKPGEENQERGRSTTRRNYLYFLYFIKIMIY